MKKDQHCIYPPFWFQVFIKDIFSWGKRGVCGEWPLQMSCLNKMHLRLYHTVHAAADFYCKSICIDPVCVFLPNAHHHWDICFFQIKEFSHSLLDIQYRKDNPWQSIQYSNFTVYYKSPLHPLNCYYYYSIKEVFLPLRIQNRKMHCFPWLESPGNCGKCWKYTLKDSEEEGEWWKQVKQEGTDGHLQDGECWCYVKVCFLPTGLRVFQNWHSFLLISK